MSAALLGKLILKRPGEQTINVTIDGHTTLTKIFRVKYLPDPAASLVGAKKGGHQCHQQKFKANWRFDCRIRKFRIPGSSF